MAIETSPAAPAARQGSPVLTVRNLGVDFYVDKAWYPAASDVSYDLHSGEVLAIVGESGSGKSQSSLALLGLLPPNGRARGSAKLGDRELIGMSHGGLRHVRGKEISMIFQEPMTSFSPVHTIGSQIAENVLLHSTMTKEEARQHSIEMLRKVGVPRAEDRFDAYPFQLSGGLRQRAMIAMALSNNPQLLIADEPTTALDVTTQAQILELMKQLQDEFGMAMIFITHDLGVVAEIADEVAVMYLGIVAERGNVDQIFHEPRHPYTRALLRSIPRLGQATRERLDSIRGMVPDPYNRPPGCPFNTRCDFAMPGICDRILPPTTDLGYRRDVRCLLYEPDYLDTEQSRRIHAVEDPVAEAYGETHGTAN